MTYHNAVWRLSTLCHHRFCILWSVTDCQLVSEAVNVSDGLQDDVQLGDILLYAEAGQQLVQPGM